MINSDAVDWLENSPHSPYNLDHNTRLRWSESPYENMRQFYADGRPVTDDEPGVGHNQPMFILKEDCPP